MKNAISVGLAMGISGAIAMPLIIITASHMFGSEMMAMVILSIIAMVLMTLAFIADRFSKREYYPLRHKIDPDVKMVIQSNNQGNAQPQLPDLTGKSVYSYLVHDDFDDKGKDDKTITTEWSEVLDI